MFIIIWKTLVTPLGLGKSVLLTTRVTAFAAARHHFPNLLFSHLDFLYSHSSVVCGKVQV